MAKAKVRNIIVEMVDGAWTASVDGSPGTRGVGDTSREALGQLIALFAPDFGVKVTLVSPKENK